MQFNAFSIIGWRLARTIRVTAFSSFRYRFSCFRLMGVKFQTNKAIYFRVTRVWTTFLSIFKHICAAKS